MDGEYLVIVLSGQGGITAIRAYTLPVALFIRDRLNEITGYRCKVFHDPKTGPVEPIPEAQQLKKRV